jgi:hypothetical protein
MAVETPLHLQGIPLNRQWHLIDTAMTRFASHAFFHMDAVIEVHEVRQIVHPDPSEWTILAKTRANRLENGRIRPDLRVTVHTRLRWRNPREPGCFHRRVAIPAIDAVVTDVVKVAELDWLFDEFLSARHIRRSAEDDEKTNSRAREEHNPDNTGARDRICAATKYLRHRIVTVGSAAWRLFGSLHQKGTGRAGFVPRKPIDLYHVVKKGSSRHKAESGRYFRRRNPGVR